VYAESAFPLLYGDGKPRELAQWSAIRLTRPDEQFDAVIQTNAPMPEGRYLQDLQWNSATLDTAESFEQVRARWRSFLRDDDVVVSWNKGTLRLAKEHGLVEEGLVLKQAYQNTTTRKFGTLDDVVAHDQLVTTVAPSVVGRAAGRLANSHAAALALGRWARVRQASPQ
jgi:hypothetical protein